MYNELFVNVLIGCIMSHIVIGTLANRQITKLLHMNRICNLFGIKYPIIQGGMVWCSGWRLASAVSNAGRDWGLIGVRLHASRDLTRTHTEMQSGDRQTFRSKHFR